MASRLVGELGKEEGDAIAPPQQARQDSLGSRCEGWPKAGRRSTCNHRFRRCTPSSKWHQYASVIDAE